MKVWNAFFNLIAVVILFFMLIVFNNMITVNDRQFEQLRLSYAVDYATDAALFAGANAGANKVDSGVDLGRIQINMNNLLPTFDSLIALSYDMTLDEDSFIIIEQSIATGVLCAWNGYYVLENYEVDNTPYDALIGGEYKLLWGIKRPYLCYIEDGGDTRLFSFHLNKSDRNVTEFSKELLTDSDGKGIRLRYYSDFDYVEYLNDPSKYDFNDVNFVKSKNGGSLLNDNIRKESISKCITEDINIAINARNNLNVFPEMRHFYMPSSESLSAINSIDSPSLIMILQDATKITGYSVDSISVGGAKAQARRQIAVFYFNPGNPYGISSDIMFYCYAGQIEKAKEVSGTNYSAYTTTLTSVGSIYEAIKTYNAHPHIYFLSMTDE